MNVNAISLICYQTKQGYRDTETKPTKRENKIPLKKDWLVYRWLIILLFARDNVRGGTNQYYSLTPGAHQPTMYLRFWKDHQLDSKKYNGIAKDGASSIRKNSRTVTLILRHNYRSNERMAKLWSRIVFMPLFSQPGKIFCGVVAVYLRIET